MPCSRSAVRPSVSSDRSISSSPFLRAERSSAATWSAGTTPASYRSRPISELLPSSTLPAVVKRRRPPSCALDMSEIPGLLALFHGGLGRLVVEARGTALADTRLHRLGDDGMDIGGVGLHRQGAGDVADGAEAHHAGLDAVVGPKIDDVGDRQEDLAAHRDRARVGVIE